MPYDKHGTWQDSDNDNDHVTPEHLPGEWITTKGEKMATKTAVMSKPQKLQMQLLRMATFNDFDGNFVGDSLLENRGLWKAFLIDRESYSAEYKRREIREMPEKKVKGQLPVSPIDTVRLRDLAQGYWNVDALFILPVDGMEHHLVNLAQTWMADEIDWCDGLDAGPQMLRVWWD